MWCFFHWFFFICCMYALILNLCNLPAYFYSHEFTTHHIGLPGLLYVVCGDDNRDFSHLHNLYQVLPDPRKKTDEIFETLGPLSNWFFLKIEAYSFTASCLIFRAFVITQWHLSNTLTGCKCFLIYGSEYTFEIFVKRY